MAPEPQAIKVGREGETHVQRQIHVGVKNVNAVQSAVLSAGRVGRDHDLQLGFMLSSCCHHATARKANAEQ